MVAGGLSIALGVWPDIGALMIAAFAIPAAAWFHRFWEVEDPVQRQFQQGYFGRNVIIVGACLVMFAFFAASGDAIRYAITSPAITFLRRSGTQSRSRLVHRRTTLPKVSWAWRISCRR